MDRIFYETNNFKVFVPEKPHVSKEDGGHLCIMSKDDNIESRLDLSIEMSIEFIRLSMLIGEAMRNSFNDIVRINYQENGNWSNLKNEASIFHLHLYGRTINSKHQKFGEALYLPDPSSSYYDNIKAFDDDDINILLNNIHILENTDKYNINNWR